MRLKHQQPCPDEQRPPVRRRGPLKAQRRYARGGLRVDVLPLVERRQGDRQSAEQDVIAFIALIAGAHAKLGSLRCRRQVETGLCLADLRIDRAKLRSARHRPEQVIELPTGGLFANGANLGDGRRSEQLTERAERAEPLRIDHMPLGFEPRTFDACGVDVERRHVTQREPALGNPLGLRGDRDGIEQKGVLTLQELRVEEREADFAQHIALGNEETGLRSRDAFSCCRSTSLPPRPMFEHLAQSDAKVELSRRSIGEARPDAAIEFWVVELQRRADERSLCLGHPRTRGDQSRRSLTSDYQRLR